MASTNREVVQDIIVELLSEIITQNGHEVPVIDGDSVFLDSNCPIDSLDLAQLVVRLEDRFGKDPFANGFIEFRTVSELAALYE